MTRPRPSTAKLKTIRALFVDVDGVLTDGSIVYGASGEMLKAFNVKDGHGIVEAKGKGVEIGIITGRNSDIVARRAADLGITEVHQNSHDKGRVLKEVLARRGWSAAEVAFIGDDEPDLPVLLAVGFSAAPADSVEAVKKRVMYVCKAGGGKGAVREVIDLILSARSKKTVKH